MKQKFLRQTKFINDQKAFTLVEVMLYLAVTGLIILVGFNAVSGRTVQVQFSDSMRELHGFINAQYAEFNAGVKPTDDSCVYETGNPNPRFDLPSDGTCILFGKVFIFEADIDSPSAEPAVVRVYNLVGRNLDSTQYGPLVTDCNSEDLRCVNPHVLNFNSPLTHQILWGTKFVKGNERTHNVFYNSGAPGDDANERIDNVRGFGWLREPVTNKLIPIVFGSSIPSTQFIASDLNNQQIYRSFKNATENFEVGMAATGTEFNSAFCFVGPGDFSAMLVFGEGESQEVVNLNFEQVTLSHDCTV